VFLPLVMAFGAVIGFLYAFIALFSFGLFQVAHNYLVTIRVLLLFDDIIEDSEIS
jgi:hypothetical protein